MLEMQNKLKFATTFPKFKMLYQKKQKTKTKKPLDK